MGFRYRYTLTIDHTQCGGSDSSGFAVLAYASDVRFKDDAHGGHVQHSDGSDILFFSDSSGTTQLPSEIESYDNVNGILWAWVKITTVSHTADTVFYCLLGNPSPPARTANPWNSDYRAVYHEINPSTSWAYPVRYGGNPIISHGGGGWKDSQVQEPVVMVDPSDATKLIMFYAGMAAPPVTGVMSIGRATATVASPTVWTEYVSNPIISDTSRRLDSVVYDSGTFYLYSSNMGTNSIDLFTSGDGFTFTLAAANVLTPTGQGRTDGNYVSQGAVLKEGSTWYMYYAYRNTPGSVLQGYRYATSSDGTTWTKGGSGDLISVGDLITGEAGDPDASYMEWHQIMKQGSAYVLVYEGYSGYTNIWTINVAYSSSPTSGWVKAGANPVFRPSGTIGAFDRYQVATPAFYEIGGTWYLFYQGDSTSGDYGNGPWDLGMATLGGDPSTSFVAGVIDSTSNTFSLVDTATTSTDKIDGARVFNGSTSNQGIRGSVITATDNFTLEAWVKPGSLSQLGMFIHAGSDNGVNRGTGYGIGIGDGSGGTGAVLSVVFSGVAWFNSGFSFSSTSAWVHVVLVRDSGTAKCYANGSQTVNTSATIPVAPPAEFHIGSQIGNSFVNASIDEVRVSTIVRGADWITTEYNNQNNPGNIGSPGFLTWGNEFVLISPFPPFLPGVTP